MNLMYHKAAEAFMLRHGMHPDNISLNDTLSAFTADMAKGLVGEDSSFAMLPTYLCTEGELPEDEPVLVIDAGGTKLRTALVRFHGGAAVIEDLRTTAMPGSLSPLTKAEYLQQMTEILRPMLGKAEAIGYCFSYSAKILPNRDGILEHFNKGVKVEDTDGMQVCRELDKALTDAGLNGSRRWVLLNDSAATVCGGLPLYRSGSYDGIIGFILGTGTNTCYEEDAAAVSRYGLSGTKGKMLINMECGAFDKIPLGDFDRALHAADPQPGQHIYEKMVSGAYQGRLVFLAAEAAAEEGLFSAGFAEKIGKEEAFVTSELDSFVQDPEGTSRPAALCDSEEDRNVLFSLADCIAARAAKLAAVNLVGAAVHRNAGADPARPALIIAEGSTFWRYSLFRPKLMHLLKTWGEGEHGCHLVIRAAENANLIGSAAAALLNH